MRHDLAQYAANGPSRLSPLAPFTLCHANRMKDMMFISRGQAFENLMFHKVGPWLAVL